MLGPLGLARPPYDACVSVVNFDERSGSMVTTYKDAGDQGLSHVLARLMYAVTPHEWLGLGTAVSFLPASAKAYQRRGWDHAQLLARAYAAEVGLPLVPLFARPGAIDQRALGRKERFANMEKSIRLLGGVTPPSRVIIIDDVYTTGSTLFAAATCIKNVRPDAQVFCLTFARA